MFWICHFDLLVGWFIVLFVLLFGFDCSVLFGFVFCDCGDLFGWFSLVCCLIVSSGISCLL